jgi:very-short-patch-repair endonuclease
MSKRTQPNFRGDSPKAILTARAKQLRSNATEAEKILWSFLRAKRLLGHYFRRQHQIGIYIVDFYCGERRLVVEVDGGIHQRTEVQAKDYEREEYFAAGGYKVVRLKNEMVLEKMPEALEKIKVALKENQPSPGLSQREG